MRLLKISALVVLFVTTFIACSATSNIHLDENYPKNQSTDTFAVLPFNQNWFPGAATKDMYGQEIDFFYQALDPSFSSSTSNKVQIIRSELPLAANSFKQTKLTTEKESLEVTLPPDSLLSSISERYIYFFEDYGFKMLQKPGERVSFAYLESESKLALQFETKFYLYDKNTSKIISWGKVSDNSELDGRPKFLDYLSVLTKVSQQILIDSPFQVTP